jgi:hypothetical protein
MLAELLVEHGRIEAGEVMLLMQTLASDRLRDEGAVSLKCGSRNRTQRNLRSWPPIIAPRRRLARLRRRIQNT